MPGTRTRSSKIFKPSRPPRIDSFLKRPTPSHAIPARSGLHFSVSRSRTIWSTYYVATKRRFSLCHDLLVVTNNNICCSISQETARLRIHSESGSSFPTQPLRFSQIYGSWYVRRAIESARLTCVTNELVGGWTTALLQSGRCPTAPSFQLLNLRSII